MHCVLCLAEDQVLMAVSQPRALLHTLAELNEHEKKGNFPKVLEGDGVCAAQ